MVLNNTCYIKLTFYKKISFLYAWNVKVWDSSSSLICDFWNLYLKFDGTVLWFYALNSMDRCTVLIMAAPSVYWSYEIQGHESNLICSPHRPLMWDKSAKPRLDWSRLFLWHKLVSQPFTKQSLSFKPKIVEHNSSNMLKIWRLSTPISS